MLTYADVCCRMLPHALQEAVGGDASLAAYADVC
jgi:hypothetical protein